MLGILYVHNIIIYRRRSYIINIQCNKSKHCGICVCVMWIAYINMCVWVCESSLFTIWLFFVFIREDDSCNYWGVWMFIKHVEMIGLFGDAIIWSFLLLFFFSFFFLSVLSYFFLFFISFHHRFSWYHFICLNLNWLADSLTLPSPHNNGHDQLITLWIRNEMKIIVRIGQMYLIPCRNHKIFDSTMLN